jgi:transposase InsO family protein
VVLGINRAHVYYRSKIKVDDTELLNRINEIYEWRPVYGYRKIWVHLREEGYLINKKRVHRLPTLHGIKISHDGVGRCIDNIRIEPFWRTLKYEDVHIRDYANVTEAREGISEFIAYYNNERPHQALRYNRPRDVYLGHRRHRVLPARTAAA